MACYTNFVQKCFSKKWALLVLSCLSVIFSLYILRVFLGQILGFATDQDYIVNGFRVGVLLDVVMLLLGVPIGFVLWALLKLPPQIYLVLHFAFYWISSLANVLYFDFFKSRLYWWVVREQWRDLFVVKSSAAHLAMNPMVMSSVALFALSLVLLKKSSPRISFFRKRWQGAIFAFVFLLPLIFLHQARWSHRTAYHRILGTPSNVHEYFSPVREQIQEVWFATWSGMPAYEQKFIDVKVESGKPASELFQDLRHPEQVSSSKLRQELGLPKDGPLNVVVLFFESWRWHEFENASFSEDLFPNLSRLKKRHATYFPTAYSSSLKAAQTVRGIFSSLCSFYPNVFGPAAMILNPKLNIDCLQKRFADESYLTMWLSPHDKEFHRQVEFEHSQKSQIIRDVKDRRLLKKVTEHEFGIIDEDHLALLGWEHAQIVSEQSRWSGNFLHSINVGTHHPWTLLKDEDLPAALVKKLQNPSETYLRYLKSLHVADRAFGHLIDALFAAQDAERTLVLVMADHGATETPDSWNSDEPREEYYFRVPILFLSKNHRNPRALHHTPCIRSMSRLQCWISWG